jgi:hypothetical protein
MQPLDGTAQRQVRDSLRTPEQLRDTLTVVQSLLLLHHTISSDPLEF